MQPSTAVILICNSLQHRRGFAANLPNYAVLVPLDQHRTKRKYLKKQYVFRNDNGQQVILSKSIKY